MWFCNGCRQVCVTIEGYDRNSLSLYELQYSAVSLTSSKLGLVRRERTQGFKLTDLAARSRRPIPLYYDQCVFLGRLVQKYVMRCLVNQS